MKTPSPLNLYLLLRVFSDSPQCDLWLIESGSGGATWSVLHGHATKEYAE